MKSLKIKLSALALSLLLCGSFIGTTVVSERRYIQDITNEESAKFSLEEDDTFSLADTSTSFASDFRNETDLSEKRWLIVTLEGDSLAESSEGSSLLTYAESSRGEKRQKSLVDKQQKFLNRLKAANIPFTYKYGYTLLTNAVAVECQLKYANVIEKISGVKSVDVSEYYYAPQDEAVSNNANVWGTGIYKVDQEILDRYDGSGMLVAVLDTGLDASHEAFRVMPEDKSKLVTKSDIQERIFDNETSKGLLALNSSVTADDVYYNEKIPFAFDYANRDPDVYPSYSSHGTHVAGIIAGAPLDEVICDQDGNPILDKDGNEMKFTGVAPEAQLAICKVFTDNEDSESLGGAETVDILAALEDCVKLGVDVINMSLGSSAGFSTGDDDYMQLVYDNVRAAGISLIVAASNDYSSAYNGAYGTNLATNPDSATVGWPSTFPGSLSVASINGQQSKYIRVTAGGEEKFLYFTEASDGNGNEKDFIKELKEKNPSLVGENGEIVLDYVVVPGYGLSVNYSRNIDVKGKVAVVRRGGDVSFEDKDRFDTKKNGQG